MYGSRARIGYTYPLLLAEVFTYEFYLVAPKGVTLVSATGTIWQATQSEVEESLKISLQVAKEMGRNGVNLIVLGGIPVNLARGFAKVGEIIKMAEEASGVPVTTSVTAQINALRQLKARRIGVVQIAEPTPPPRPEDDYLTLSGFQTVATKGVGSKPSELGRLPSAVNARVARELAQKHPEIDTLYFPGPHRATLDQIETLEQSLNVNVVTATQAIIWEAFRKCGIREPIPGYGRLLRE
jgi:maleate cis-trans isomerase